MSTPAVRTLEKTGVPFELHTYEVDDAVGEGYGQAVAAAIGVEAGRVFKTLMAEVDGEHVAAIVPVDSRLSLKGLARAAGGKKAAMAHPADAERLTGYVTGGISPIGQRRRHRTFLDDTAASFATIYVSAGKRGLQVELGPDHLLALTRATLASLT